jgi:hypothetical protein
MRMGLHEGSDEILVCLAGRNGTVCQLFLRLLLLARSHSHPHVTSAVREELLDCSHRVLSSNVNFNIPSFLTLLYKKLGQSKPQKQVIRT